MKNQGIFAKSARDSFVFIWARASLVETDFFARATGAVCFDFSSFQFLRWLVLILNFETSTANHGVNINPKYQRIPARKRRK